METFFRQKLIATLSALFLLAGLSQNAFAVRLWKNWFRTETSTLRRKALSKTATIDDVQNYIKAAQNKMNMHRAQWHKSEDDSFDEAYHSRRETYHTDQLNAFNQTESVLKIKAESNAATPEDVTNYLNKLGAKINGASDNPEQQEAYKEKLREFISHAQSKVTSNESTTRNSSSLRGPSKEHIDTIRLHKALPFGSHHLPNFTQNESVQKAYDHGVEKLRTEAPALYYDHIFLPQISALNTTAIKYAKELSNWSIFDPNHRLERVIQENLSDTLSDPLIQKLETLGFPDYRTPNTLDALDQRGKDLINKLTHAQTGAEADLAVNQLFYFYLKYKDILLNETIEQIRLQARTAYYTTYPERSVIRLTDITDYLETDIEKTLNGRAYYELIKNRTEWAAKMEKSQTTASDSNSVIEDGE